MSYLDSNLVFNTALLSAGAAGDIVSTNIIDLAPVFGAGVIGGGNQGPGENAFVLLNITTGFGSAAGGTWQPVLQTANDVAFTASKNIEYPMLYPLTNANVSSASTSGGVLTVTTLTDGTIQIGSQLYTGSSVASGVFVTGQLTGTAGIGGGATYSVSSPTAALTVTSVNSAYLGRQIVMRLPTELRRYLRLAYRTTTTTSTLGYTTAYITTDAQIAPIPVGPSFIVG